MNALKIVCTKEDTFFTAQDGKGGTFDVPIKKGLTIIIDCKIGEHYRQIAFAVDAITPENWDIVQKEVYNAERAIIQALALDYELM